jgi:hypothetical protein
MKKVLIAFSLFALLNACNSATNNKNETTISQGAGVPEQSDVDSSNWTKVLWLDSSQNFGKVMDGEKVLITFHFKNTGTKPLVFTNVQAGCGCTVPSKPEEPILPGQEGEIKAEFNSSGRAGHASKYINVTCNTKEQNYTLRFEGEVLSKK